MQYEITNFPYSLATIVLEAEENIYVISGGLHSFMGEFDLKTNITKPNFKDYLAILLSGKSFVTNQFVAISTLNLTLAPKFSGTICSYLITHKIYINPANLLAWYGNIEIKTTFLNKKFLSFFTDEALFTEIQGNGSVFIAFYGDMIEKNLENETIYVDNKYLVGFEDGITCEHLPLKNIKKSFLSGEGIILKLQGNGKIWLQTRELIKNSNLFSIFFDMLF
jgi:uncharacterized protein (TIGR00266 family)